MMSIKTLLGACSHTTITLVAVFTHKAFYYTHTISSFCMHTTLYEVGNQCTQMRDSSTTKDYLSI